MKLSNLKHKIKLFLANQSGVAFMEFVITVPILLIIVYSTVEITRYSFVKQKVSNANTAIVNMFNQLNEEGVNQATLNYMAAIFPESLKPYDSANWTVIVNAVYKKSGTNCETYSIWQVKKGHDYPIRKSKVADEENKPAKIPGYDNKFQTSDQLITVETYLKYEPLFSNFFTNKLGFGNTDMYSIFTARPRYGAFLKHPETGNQLTPVCEL